MIVTPHPHAKGFSLVEMLVTLAALGVLISLALISIGGINSASKTATYRRNAQSIATLAATASAAGANFVVAGDKVATVENLVAGTRPSSGIFKDRVFRLPGMKAEDIQGAMEYLQITNDGLSFLYEYQLTKETP